MSYDQETQAIDSNYDDQPDEEENPNAWCRLTSISVHTEKAKPPLVIPSTIVIDKEKFTIGRAGTNDLAISHLGISGNHLEITRCGKERICIMMDKSTNGTWINGNKMIRQQHTEVDFGSKIEILRANETRVAFTVGDVNTQHALLGGKYAIRRDLGSGAYADVKLAMDPNSGYQYAIKIIEKSKLGLNPTAQNQLLEEVRILRDLNHHAVVNCHDYFSNESRFYIVLDYLPAGDLLEYLISRKIPFEEHEAKDIFCQLTEAVHYLHQNNVVHRDIKPENILLDDREIVQIKKKQRGSMVMSAQSQSQQNPVKPDLTNVTSSQMIKLHRESTKERYQISNKLRMEYSEQPELGSSGLRIKLTDFGLSKSTQEKSSRLKTICGTPQYLAPEVLKHFSPTHGTQDRSYGKEIDVWSLGAILFVLLTVNTPFNEQNLMQAALAGDYEKHRLRNLSPEVRDIIDRMLTVDPKKRITTAEIFQHKWCADLFAQRKLSLEEKKKETAERLALEAAIREGDEQNTTTTNTTTFHAGNPASASAISATAPTPTSNSASPQHQKVIKSTINQKPTSPMGATKRSAHQANMQQVGGDDDDRDDALDFRGKKQRNSHNNNNNHRQKFDDDDEVHLGDDDFDAE